MHTINATPQILQTHVSNVLFASENEAYILYATVRSSKP